MSSPSRFPNLTNWLFGTAALGIQVLKEVPIVASSPPWLSPIAALAGGVLGYTVNRITSAHDKSEEFQQASRELLTNRDIALTQASGIAARLRRYADELDGNKMAAECNRLRELADATKAWWLASVSDPARDDLSSLRDDEVVNTLTNYLTTNDPFEITEATWIELLEDADRVTPGKKFEPGMTAYFAKYLCGSFRHDFVEALKTDFMLEGKGFAAVSLRFFAELLSETRNLVVEQKTMQAELVDISALLVKLEKAVAALYAAPGLVPESITHLEVAEIRLRSDIDVVLIGVDELLVHAQTQSTENKELRIEIQSLKQMLSEALSRMTKFRSSGSKKSNQVVSRRFQDAAKKSLAEISAQTAIHAAALQQISQSVAQLSKEQAKVEARARLIKPSRLADDRRKMQQMVRSYWIEGVLHQAVKEADRFQIGHELVPTAVITDNRFPDREFGPDDDIAELFDAYGSRLLILGSPGGGKTMLLLRLAERLIERAEADNTASIPIVLNLSSWWSDQLPLDQWIIRETANAYQIPAAVITRWVRDESIIPLLDGLDEVGLGSIARQAWVEATNREDAAPVEDDGVEGAAAKEARTACLKAINRFCQLYRSDLNSKSDFGIAVCSRSTEYHELTEQLHLNGALKLQDLSECQVHAVLSQERMKGVCTIAEHETWIRKMARNPFLLNVMSVAYSEATLIEKSSQKERQDHLMAEYVNRRLKETRDRRESSLDATGVRHLLKWLAKNMTSSGQTVFHIESLQITWLSKLWSQSLYSVLSRWLFGLSAVFCGSFFSSFISAMVQMVPLKGNLIATSAVEQNKSLTTELLLIPASAIKMAALWGSVFLFAGVMASTIHVARSQCRNSETRSTLKEAAIISLTHALVIALFFIATVVAVLLLVPKSSPLSTNPEFLAKTTLASSVLGVAFASITLLVSICSIRFAPKLTISSIYAVAGFTFWGLSGLIFLIYNSDGLREMVASIVTSAAIGMAGAIIGAIGGLIDDRIRPTERIEWRWQTASAVWGASACSLMFVLMDVGIWLRNGSQPSVSGILNNLGGAFGVGVVCGALSGFHREECIIRRVRPNDGIVRSIRSSLRRALLFPAIGAFCGAIVITLMQFSGVSEGANFLALILVSIGAVVLFWIGALSGGLDVPLKHYVLRITLRFSERIPLQLARNLDAIASILLLRRVAGGFIFAHRFLLEHFASLAAKDDAARQSPTMALANSRRRRTPPIRP